MPLPPALTPAPSNNDIRPKDPKTYQSKPLPKILPNIPQPIQSQNTPTPNVTKQGTMPTIPFPLLILNGLQANANSGEKKDSGKSPSGFGGDSDINHILRELLDVQKENLDIEKQRLDLERQRLDFERFVGSQLLAMGPVLGGLFQRFAYPHEAPSDEEKNGKKRQSPSEFEILKDTKILKTLLSEGIKNYMMGEDSENDDSGINNDDTNSDK